MLQFFNKKKNKSVSESESEKPKSKPDYDLLLKFQLIGNSNVGKNEYLKLIADDNNRENYISKIGVDFVIKTITHNNNKLIKIQIWDTDGQERFITIDNPSFFRGAHGIIIFFDITNLDSFNNAKTWIQQIERNTPKTVSKILIGTRCHLTENRLVTSLEAQTFVNPFSIPYIEISIETLINIEQSYMTLLENILLNLPKK
eukprot:TRINITY_DN5993_c0_g1_i1.p1 TRINITY_DN5993_c0_g1~~TRINITY_DN5993_c0_g1_i1.p1  ORF type:complete len:219 (-),score=75.18 TRINITY_DN5993_c0_g1_i1:64-666(-)